MERRREKRWDDTSEEVVSIVPIGSKEGEVPAQSVLDLQLKMATSSINHEYARMEYDDTEAQDRREELLDYMHDCRNEYFSARIELENFDPYALAEFEADLFAQKQRMLTVYHA